MVQRALRVLIAVSALSGVSLIATAQDSAAPPLPSAVSGALLAAQEATLAEAKTAQETQLATVRQRNIEQRIAAAEAQARAAERQSERSLPSLQGACTLDGTACAERLTLRGIVDREKRIAEQRLDRLSELQRSLERRLAGEGPKGGLDRR